MCLERVHCFQFIILSFKNGCTNIQWRKLSSYFIHLIYYILSVNILDIKSRTLSSNVKYSKFTKIYIANWVNNIVYFFAKFHWTFLTFHDCIGFCSIKAKGRKQWGGFDFTGAKGQIPQSWKWIFCQLLFGTFQSRCPPVDYQYRVPTP